MSLRNAPSATRITATLRRMFELALHALGPQRWWPGDSPFEVCVGAVLTQNTNWSNVERAIRNLKAARVLSPRALHRMPAARLAALVRPAGYFNVKARRLKSFIAHVVNRLGGRVQSLSSQPLDRARADLLAVHGIGPETADSMLLYAAGHPTFVCDTYTRRILSRHGLCPPDAEYHAMQRLFHRALPERDAPLYNEFHALIVAIGKDYCRPRNPRCDACPLGPLLTPLRRRSLQTAATPAEKPARNPRARSRSTPPAAKAGQTAPRRSPPR